MKFLFLTVPVLLAHVFPAIALSLQQTSVTSDRVVALLHDKGSLLMRRSVLQWGLATAALGVPLESLADHEAPAGLLSPSDVAELLHPVPTFAIVDKKGVPFMVVGEDAKVTGYFFTTYQEAYRILKLARSSADKAISKAKAEGQSAEEIGINPWKNARISSVPLDFALTLVSKSGMTRGGGNYFKIAPAETDIDDALAIAGEKNLAEGKVPLFYFADFVIESNGLKRTPVYFRKSELESDFMRLNPGNTVPTVLVTELLSVLAELVTPGGSDSDLKALTFMPPRESERKKNECDKAGGNEASFFLGQRLIIL